MKNELISILRKRLPPNLLYNENRLYKYVTLFKNVIVEGRGNWIRKQGGTNLFKAKSVFSRLSPLLQESQQ